MSNLSDVSYLSLADVLALPVYEVADIFPMLIEVAGPHQVVDTVTLAELAGSIEKNGIREPLIIWNGTLLDGRNRRAASEIAQLEVVPVVYFTGTQEEADEYIFDLNLDRRDLTKGQRALVADRYRAIIEARQAANLSLGAAITNAKRWGGESLPPNLAEATIGDSRDLLAHRFRVAHSYVDAAKKMREAGRTELIAKVERGGSMNAAIEEFRGKQAAAVEKSNFAASASPADIADRFEKKIDRAISAISDAIADHAEHFGADDLRYIVQNLENLIRQAERTFA